MSGLADRIVIVFLFDLRKQKFFCTDDLEVKCRLNYKVRLKVEGKYALTFIVMMDRQS